MSASRVVGGYPIGEDSPCYVIGEIGINHNGDMAVAKELIDVAVSAGCNAIKFQKRTPLRCVPAEQRNVMRETPWGTMTYLDYRYKVEFEQEEYEEIDDYCRNRGIDWFASPWDEEAVEFLTQFDPVAYKVASASLTDNSLLDRLNQTGKPVILSTGMSTLQEIEEATSRLTGETLLIAHSTSTYPCPAEQLNLRMIGTLQRKYDVPIGYSGHETGIQTTLAAVVLGAKFVERHITLDRAMWGTDQSASLEPSGLHRLVRDIRTIEKALGDGIKKVYEEEIPIRDKLRRSG